MIVLIPLGFITALLIWYLHLSYSREDPLTRFRPPDRDEPDPET